MAADELSYAGRVVVVTGAGRGIGRAYALEFARRGASVVVNDVGASLVGEGAEAEPADETVAEVRRAGGVAVASHDSVAEVDGSRRIVGAALESFGRVDALVNNAGILRMRPFEEVTREGLQQHLDVHVIGTVMMCKAVWPHFTSQGYGRIVNTVSGGIFGLPKLGEYGPAKGGVFAFTRSLALEALPQGVRVNAVAPQAATRMLRASGLSPELRAQLDEKMKTELVVPGAVYLAHEACELNGETLAVSGGKVCRIGLTYNDGFTDAAVTPEMIHQRLDEVLDASSARHWTSATSRYEERVREA